MDDIRLKINLTLKQLIVASSAYVVLFVVFIILGSVVAPQTTFVTLQQGSHCISNESLGVVELSECQVHDLSNVEYNQQDVKYWIRIGGLQDGLIITKWMRFMLVYLEINHAGANNTQVDRLKTTMTSKLYTAPEDNTWKLLYQSTNEVYLESNGCSNQPLCDSTQLLRLEPLTYHQYMMVVTFPRNFSPKAMILKINAKAIFQTKRFTLTFIGIRLVPTLILLITTFWFHNVISHLPSKTALHRSIILLGITTALVDFPFELIVMFFDAGWLLVIIRLLTQANYAALLIFWVVFMDEHKVNNHPKRQLRLRIYIGTICAFLSLQAVANLTIQGLVLANPFNINLTLNLVEALLGVVMFGYLLVSLFAEAASFISASDTSVCGVLPLTMRLRLLIIHFIITDVVTVIYSILTEIYKMDVKGSSCSGLYTITFYLWNIQAFVIMILYSPRKSEIPNQALQEQ